MCIGRHYNLDACEILALAEEARTSPKVGFVIDMDVITTCNCTTISTHILSSLDLLELDWAAFDDRVQVLRCGRS